ncbi:glycoside hydrolase family 36 protein [Clostridium cellulovorans]|uniref:Glycoside hydrolase clan GH-D n=1 Tax=Clostridium cellulovorans (strain ATCC 35296 / DSM 3052 / OCM 3 / 743B) TaxID=573061 RepID=D9SQL7_CLOC7|nr:alpha-galactosidase [Clostridium cellulovorans]ADL52223.1 glycoside hydrolase clan GH-D [Clostridium cellulovorans 743B]
MNLITINENNINMVLEITKENEVKLLHFSALPFDERDILAERQKVGFRLVEINISGLDRPLERHGTKYIVTAPGYRMKYDSHKDYYNELGRKLEIVTFDYETGIYVTSHFQFYKEISVVRSWSEVINKGKETQTLEYISSFNLTGIEKEGILDRDEKMSLKIPHNSWQREIQWETYSLEKLGIAQSQPEIDQRSSKVIAATNTGNWSTKEYLPMAYLENLETHSNLFWQIEHNGSWHWEISDQTGHLYIQLSGPTETESHWFKNLKPDESFISVPVAVGVSLGNFDVAMGELTKYRRVIRRPNKDNEGLGIIFNDYMNCLWGDPTTEKELPLIDAAAEVGCEYFCIDAGWYSAGFWWDNVGEWLPSKERFPNGLKEVIDYIRSKNMIPGVWLEIEVMGIKCPKVQQVPEDWFFVRHGKKVYDRSRYQLDFRNPEVVKYANEVIDRLISEYGVGYIKMDYNIEPGIGTELKADSIGDGLLEHERAYLAWIDSVFERYPDLIIENCSSGGLRIDYAMLSRYSIQSTSDQDDYRRYATIAANSPSGLTPEQSAIWSYPLTEGDKEEVIFNMINAMLLRIHQSGHLAKISEERKVLVKEALDYYKTMRLDIKKALPFWPLGLSKFSDTWVSLGLKAEKKSYVAVWRRNSVAETNIIPIEHLKGKNVSVKCAYPKAEDCEYRWNSVSGTLSVRFKKQFSARLFEIIEE